MLGKRPQRVHHLAGTGRTIEPHHVGTAGRDQRGGGQRLGPEQHAPGRIERDLRDHWNAPADVLHRLPGAEDLRSQLEEILGGLRDDAVDAPLEQRARLLAEDLHQLGRSHASEVRIAGGGQKSAGTERPGHEPRATVGALRAGSLLARDPRRFLVHLQHFRAQIELVQLGAAPAERVRLDDVAAHLEVGAVHPGNDVGAGQGQDLVTALPAVEVLDGQISRKLHPLQRRAHGAVENDDSSGDCIEKVLVCHF